MKLLVFNRGEIAARACLAARSLGVPCVLFVTPPDLGSPAVRFADELYLHDAAEPEASYLSLDALARAIAASGASHVYPGYGFLSESARLAEACLAAGVGFVGPRPELLAELGHKRRARRLAEEAGLRHLGLDPDPPADAYPVLLKAVAGGGGRGNLRVDRPQDLAAARAGLERRALALFGDAELALERWLPRARHLELQVFGLADGVRALGTRDCSLQRRQQKLLEEGPAPTAARELLEPHLGGLLSALSARGYRGAGTVELLLDPQHGALYFLELNPRIQVEHPVTEVCLGVDLVECQLREALGLDPGLGEPLAPRGHAFQARVLAEDVHAGCVPDAGRVHHLDLPSLPFCRWDAALLEGSEVPTQYDPLLAKLVVWGRDREEARRRLVHALDHCHVHGVRTNLGLLRAAADHPCVRDDGHHTRWIEDTLLPGLAPDPLPELDAAARLLEPLAAPAPRGEERRWKLAHRS